MKYSLDYKEYSACAIEAIASGQVLLKNNNSVLPIKKGRVVSVFGRMQNNYYKSGTGSGGMVNVNRIVGILDALKEESDAGVIKLYQPLVDVYAKWEKENPYQTGKGWGSEPWSQKEMPLEDALVADAAQNSDIAVAIIARSAGEDQDNKNDQGSYLLTDLEKDMLTKVRKQFDKMVLVLNVGNIINMSFIDELNVDGVLYAWQGGMLGGYGTAKVLTGEINPSGSLADTIAYDIEDYPSTKNFGAVDRVFYQEDIFVGYRYFESFAKDKVLYPFGYGLSYTTFEIGNDISVIKNNDELVIDLKVTNTGNFEGRKTVQIYVEAPQGVLGKPARVLAGFKKTDLIKPSETQSINIVIPFKNFASFDETGACGVGTGFVLEEGEYGICVGFDVRSAKNLYTVEFSTNLMVEALENALGPVSPFKRMKASESNGELTYIMEDTPLRKDTQKERRNARLPHDIPQTGDKGYKLSDVVNGKVSMDDFIAQLSDDELCTIIRNEGMCSTQVTAGTAAAFGGIIPSLKDKGIPVGCMDDGPSGMRLDSGMKAFSLPNGTLLACTFDPELNEKLFSFLGIEMIKNKVDLLLGPGMNIHRNPLNGRNFEYFSEDPLLTGMIASGQVKGLEKRGVTGVIKHFACNNQEISRHLVDPVVSERALREIYLRGFEIAVHNGAHSVMTTYSQLNGMWTSGSYDLNTTILRDQWGFKGIVMTDWWANISDDDTPEPSHENFAAMVRAQNELYSCTPSATADVGDNARTSLADGSLTHGELQRCAANICEFLMNYQVFKRMLGQGDEVELINGDEFVDLVPDDMEYFDVAETGEVDLKCVKVSKGGVWYFGITTPKAATYEVTLVGRGEKGNELAQIPISLYVGPNPDLSFVYRGDGEWNRQSGQLNLLNTRNVLHFYFGINGIELDKIEFKKLNDWSWS